MDETNRRLRQARKDAGFDTATEAIEHFEWEASAYRSHEGGQTSLRRLPDRAEIYAKAFNVDTAYLLGHQDVPRLTRPLKPDRPDGEKINIDELEPHQARALGAVMAGMKAEAWRITSDMMAGLPYLPGDVVIVDLAARPKPRDVVLAESSKIPIFRVYTPMGLFPLQMSGQNPPIPVDNVQIKGVVIFKLSI